MKKNQPLQSMPPSCTQWLNHLYKKAFNIQDYQIVYFLYLKSKFFILNIAF